MHRVCKLCEVASYKPFNLYIESKNQICMFFVPFHLFTFSHETFIEGKILFEMSEFIVKFF